MMTKKDFERAADITAKQFEYNPQSADIVAFAFVQLFKGDNPRFDESRFLDACKPTTEKKAPKKR